MWPFNKKEDKFALIQLDIDNLWTSLRELREEMGLVKPKIDQGLEGLEQSITKESSETQERLEETKGQLQETIEKIHRELEESVKLTNLKSTEELLKLEENLKTFFGISNYKKTQENRDLFVEGGLLAEVLNTVKETNYFIKNINKNYDLTAKAK